MAFRMHKVQVWSADIPDRPGAAAAKLEMLAQAGVDLEFVFTRPHRNKSDASQIFLAPIVGPDQVKAARSAGLAPALDVFMLCLEGDYRPDLGYEVMSRLAVAGINLQGISVSHLGNQFAAFLAFNSQDHITQAIQLLAGVHD